MMIKRKCRLSGKEFIIEREDLEFYAKMGVITEEQLNKLLSFRLERSEMEKSRSLHSSNDSVEMTINEEQIPRDLLIGLPTLCPEERQRRRLTWRNERKLYQRKCDCCEKVIISIYDDKAEFPVYCQDCWWSDKWDAKDYGQNFDFSRDFFPQWKELYYKTPRMAMAVSHCENSDYAPFYIYTKNGYMAVSCCYSEDICYSYQANRSRDCMDCSLCDECELGYQNINCKNCFEVKFSSFSRNCSSSWFLNNCIGCSDCFGCINLRNKQYYFLNKRYSREEYFKKLKELNLTSGKTLADLPAKFLNFTRKNPHRYFYGENNENCTGNDIFNCKNSKECFECFSLEDCRYCGPFPSPGGKDCYDTMYSPNSELLCDVLSGVNGYDLSFSIFSWDIKNSLYLKECFYSGNLFGCVGLKKSQYCIFNKQYTKEEYFKLRDQIIEHMKKTGEWGEFFPAKLSPFAYNETVAQEYFTLPDPVKSGLQPDENGFFQSPDLNFKYKWKEEKQSFQYTGPKYEIPDDIADVPDDIVNKVLECERSGKFYRIQPAELRFYRKMNLPIPRLHPDERHKDRMKLRNPRTLFSRNCADCGCEIQTTFAPDRPEKILCEKCYLKIVD